MNRHTTKINIAIFNNLYAQGIILLPEGHGKPLPCVKRVQSSTHANPCYNHIMCVLNYV